MKDEPSAYSLKGEEVYEHCHVSGVTAEAACLCDLQKNAERRNPALWTAQVCAELSSPSKLSCAGIPVFVRRGRDLYMAYSKPGRIYCRASEGYRSARIDQVVILPITEAPVREGIVTGMYASACAL